MDLLVGQQIVVAKKDGVAPRTSSQITKDHNVDQGCGVFPTKSKGNKKSFFSP